MANITNLIGLLIVGLIVLGLARRPQIVGTFFSGLHSNLALLTQ